MVNAIKYRGSKNVNLYSAFICIYIMYIRCHNLAENVKKTGKKLFLNLLNWRSIKEEEQIKSL